MNNSTNLFDQLREAADTISDQSRPDLQILLRRAALVIQNAGSVRFDEDVEESLRSISEELGVMRNDMVRLIVREWMQTNAYLPVHSLDEDSEVDGHA